MNRVIYFLFFLLFFWGCKKDFCPLPMDILSFDVGDIYKYQKITETDNILIREQTIYIEVTGETTINNKKYYIINDNSYRRFEDNILYILDPFDDTDRILFDFNVFEGDYVYFHLMNGIVNSIDRVEIFSEIQRKFIIVHEGKYVENNETSIYKYQWEFTTKFGFSGFIYENGGNRYTTVLVAAKINNKIYGAF